MKSCSLPDYFYYSSSLHFKITWKFCVVRFLRRIDEKVFVNYNLLKISSCYLKMEIGIMLHFLYVLLITNNYNDIVQRNEFDQK